MFVISIKNMQRQFRGGTSRSQEGVSMAGGGENEPLLLSKFIGYLNKNKLSNLMANVSNYYGKNFPIKYQKKYNFSERWEGQVYETLHEDFILQDATSPYSLLCLTALILNTLTIWVLSVERYFGTRNISHETYLYQIVSILKIIEIWAKCLIRLQREERRCLTIQILFRLIYQEVVCLAYMLYLWICGSTDHPLEYAVELLVYWLLWKAAASVYQKFKVMQFALKFESYVKIFDLLFNIFIQAHVFAIIMYSASKIDTTNNWTTATGIVNSPIMKQYIYSFYFACTTMLTIGYGDITPKNQGEVMVVVLIEIVGVVSFGYLLNEMGHTLSRMRQEREALDKDLQTIGKMAKYYSLEKSLESRAKGYLLNNQATVDELKPDEENKLLMKLNDQLRTEIANQNSLTILKSCIFFLCHWSKGFQAEIAKRLQKRLFSPNERLGEVSGERLYIIKQGKVCVYMSRFGSNQDQRKLLRVIHIESDAQVSNNIYGYTVAFSNRPVRLEAVANEFSSTYSISKEHFMECVNLQKRDFEYYHEIKCRIDQAAFCEEWEAPAIKNVREHYIPSRTFLIKRYRRQLDNELNQRFVSVKRRKSKKYVLIHDLIIKNAECIQPYSSFTEKTLQFALKEPDQVKDQIQIKQYDVSSGEGGSSSSESYSGDESFMDITNERSMELAKQFIRYRMSTTIALDEKENKKIIAYIFEARRDYCNFFPKNNLHKVLQQLEKENFHEKRYQQIFS